jgi:hypothetical protein
MQPVQQQHRQRGLSFRTGESINVALSHYLIDELFHEALSYDSPLIALSNHCVFCLSLLTQHYWS